MHAMVINENQKRIPVAKLAFGLALLTVGALTFLEAVDLWDTGPLWDYWPLILIFIGGAGEIDAIRSRRGDGSIYVLAVGVWFLFRNFHLFGMSQHASFPIAVIVAGLGITLHAVIDQPRERKESTDERQ